MSRRAARGRSRWSSFSRVISPDTTTVWLFGPIPPPVHGAARVTQQVREGVEATSTRLVAVDTGGGAGVVPRLRQMIGGLLRLAVPRRGSGRGSVYIGGAGGPTLWYQTVVVLVGRLTGRRVVFHHHSYAYVDRAMPAMRALTRAGGRRLTHVALCEGMGMGLRSRYPSVGDVRVCSNAGLMAAPEPAVEATAGGGTVVLGHLSNLSLDKGLADVVDTLRRSLAAGLDVRLLLGGPAATPEAEALVVDAVAELGDALTVLGRVERDDIDAFYEQIDVFVFPSRYVHEAEPLVVLDASRHGVPTIACAVGCLPGMVAPQHLVPLDADFAEAAVAAIGDLGSVPAQEVADRFAQRRDEALVAQAELVDWLRHRA